MSAKRESQNSWQTGRAIVAVSGTPHSPLPPAAKVFDIVQLLGENHITRKRDIRGVVEAIL
jgi:hypothetical protein